MAPPRKLALQPSLVKRRASLPACPERSRRVQADRSSPAGCGHSNRRIAIALALLLGAMIVSSPEKLFAQTPAASPTPAPPAEPDGVTRGGYQIHSSVELGYRSNDVTGSGDMYDTLVNLQTGPRILDQTLSMQSVDHQGLLFDDLYLNSVGWGGDPNNYMRLRADKNKWYNLQSSFRRDQSFFDYDLLANPLNPPTSTPSIPVLNSPHSFDTTRRMSDVDLTLLPQSRVSFRLGYSHNNMTGPSYSSIHEGTEGSLLQNWNTTMNSYRMGVDFRIAPRTVFSYDQFLDYYKGDTDYQLNPIDAGAPADDACKLRFIGFVHRHCEQGTLRRADRAKQSDCQWDPDQCHLQRVLQLRAESADPHLHTHRAHQPAQQLLPEVRGARFLFL